MSIAKYEIEVDGGAIVNAGMPELISGRRKFAIDGFEPETEHDFRMRSVSGAGIASAWTDIVSATTPAAFDPLTMPNIWAVYLADHFSGLSDEATIPNSTQWDDESGNGHHATIVAPSGGITVHHDALGDHSILAHAGTSSAYATLPNMEADMPTGGSVFKIWRIRDVNGNGADHLGRDPSSHYPYNAGDIYDDFGTNVKKGPITSSLTILNTWHVTAIYSKSNDWGMFQNYTEVFQTGTNTVLFRADPRLMNNNASSIIGDLAAVFLLSDKWTEYEFTKMMEWIAANYPAVPGL